MSKLSSNQEILDIHAMLDTPPSVEQIQNVIEKELETVQDVVRYLVSVLHPTMFMSVTVLTTTGMKLRRLFMQLCI